MRWIRALTGMVLCVASTALAQTKAEPAAPRIAALAEPIEAMQAAFGLDGAALWVGRNDKVLHLSEHGAVTADTVMPIASASKWLTAATVLTLVDEGKLDLDAPIARYLPEMDTPEKRGVTLRLCLSCTAGFAPRAGADGGAEDWDAVARAIAAAPLHGDPGLQWEYGGATFQVAAAAAVRVTGSDWHTLFRLRIAEPLGLKQTQFGRLLPPGADAGTAPVPWVAGGAVSTLREYARFVRMLAEGGQYGSIRVLKAATVDRMFTSATDGLKVRMESFGTDNLAYGFATWLQPLQGGVVRASDPGAFGFTPWIDRDLGVYGVLAVRDQVKRVLPRLQPVQQAVRDLVQSPAVSGKDEFVSLEHGGRTRRYLLHVPPGAEKALKLPLMVVLHGGGGSGEQAAESTGYSALADRHGFVVAYPDGTGPLRGRLLTWNSGGIPVYASDEKVDDTGFLRAMVASAKTKVAIDPERIYATGISNGAMMCHRLAREAPDVFAAIAPVSGAMNFTAVDSPVPIAVMIVHGTDDEHVRYAGGKPGQGMGRAALRKDASVADAIAYYQKRNHLAPEAAVAEEGKIKIATWQRATPPDASAAPLCVVTLSGGKHAWPGGKRGDYRGADEPFAWPASEQIWEFVSTQRLRAR